MEIIIANNSGLCYGVKRALRLAYETRRKKGGNVYTLGDLIHNPGVISELKKRGVNSIDNPEDIQEGTLIIRSHGVSPEIYNRLYEKKIDIVDATCPIVKKIQNLVNYLAQTENEIIIVGNENHPETKGLLGYSQGKGKVVETGLQAQSLPKKKKRAVMSQSTQDLELFQEVVAALVERTEELEVFNTICRSTQMRQHSTISLASEVDVLFIIGGKNSSNTNKLFNISRRVLPRTYFIEQAGEINYKMIEGAKKIGISGGASTPPEALEEAVVTIKSQFSNQSNREKMIRCQS